MYVVTHKDTFALSAFNSSQETESYGEWIRKFYFSSSESGDDGSSLLAPLMK